MGHRTDNIAWESSTILTISGGVVTAVQQIHTIAAETGTTDDLDTITVGFGDLTGGGNTYRPELYLISDSGDTITLKHGTGNIDLPADTDIDLDDDHYIHLLYDGTNWRLVGDYL